MDCRQERSWRSTIQILRKRGFFRQQVTRKRQNPLPAGVYVLAEIKAPSGYVRLGPVAVEIYGDRILYSGGWTEEKTAASVYGYEQDPKGSIRRMSRIQPESTRENTATILEVSKTKTIDTTRGMKVSGRVEGYDLWNFAHSMDWRISALPMIVQGYTRSLAGRKDTGDTGRAETCRRGWSSFMRTVSFRDTAM